MKHAFFALLSMVGFLGCQTQTATNCPTEDVTTGSGGTGGQPLTQSGSTSSSGGRTDTPTITECLITQCPVARTPGCASPICTDNACAFSFARETTPCGFAGHCDGFGNCTGKVDPTPCEVPCVDAGECNQSSCDLYTGTCQSVKLGNATICNLGKGHCNPESGTCCEGWQVVTCDDPDPGACFVGCMNGSQNGCQVQCEAACPTGTTPVIGQGVCIPTF